MGDVFDAVVKLPVVTDVVTTKLERILLGWGTPSPFTTNIFSLPPPLKPFSKSVLKIMGNLKENFWGQKIQVVLF